MSLGKLRGDGICLGPQGKEGKAKEWSSWQIHVLASSDSETSRKTRRSDPIFPKGPPLWASHCRDISLTGGAMINHTHSLRCPPRAWPPDSQPAGRLASTQPRFSVTGRRQLVLVKKRAVSCHVKRNIIAANLRSSFAGRHSCLSPRCLVDRLIWSDRRCRGTARCDAMPMYTYIVETRCSLAPKQIVGNVTLRYCSPLKEKPAIMSLRSREQPQPISRATILHLLQE